MADSAAKQLLAAVVAALDGAGKPAGLTIHKWRTRPIERDGLPAIVVYYRKEDAGLIAERARVSRRILRFTCEVRVTDAVPDDALDPYINWCVASLMADQTLGGTCRQLDQVEMEWDAVEVEKPYGAAAVTFEALYFTESLDRTNRVG